jgi:EmrB/QacA subfamily drug resistance transporter
LKPSHDSPPDSDADRHVTPREFLRLFVAIMLPMVMASIDQTLLATATPMVAAELGELHDSSWIATAYLLTMAVTVPIYGRLGDRYGRREMLMVALAAYVIGAVIAGSAQSMGQLVSGRAVQGIGGGGLMSLSQALIGELLPPRQRARFQGYFAALFTGTNIIGPMLGGYVVAHASWRWLYFMMLPFAAIAATLVWRLGRGEHHPNAPGVDDRIGVALFSAALLSMLFGVSSAGHRFAWLSWPMAACMGFSVVAWALLLAHEHRHRAPFFPLDLLKNKAIRLTMISVIANTFCFLSLVFYLPVYLQIGMHVSADHSGALLMPSLIGLVISGNVATRLVSRSGKPVPIPIVGLSIAAVALGGLALWPSDVVPVVALTVLATLGLGPTLPMSILVAQTVAGRDQLGAATALVSLSRTVGGALGTALMGAVIYSLLPDVDVSQLMRGGELAPGMNAQVQRAFHFAFGVAAAVAALGAYNASRVPSVRF